MVGVKFSKSQLIEMILDSAAVDYQEPKGKSELIEEIKQMLIELPDDNE